MTVRRLIISTGIVSVAGILFGCLISYLNREWMAGLIAFCPVWFIGMYYCCTPWKRFFRIMMMLAAAKASKRILTGDRYHIAENLIGGCIFAFVVTLGWIYGLGKFIYYVYTCIRDNSYQ